MILLPYRRHVVQTALAPGVALARLDPFVKKRYRGQRAGEDFHGKLTPDGFRVSRIIEGRNTYLPWVRGKLVPKRDGGTEVRIVSSLHPVALLIVVLFAAGAA